uniref:Uncharacterized protein n=1 Tax=Nothoprocta perdicaria TaxID=30464 RepID=A0A8C6ZJU5_NOTPE
MGGPGSLPAWGGAQGAPLMPFVLVVATVAWLLSAVLLGLSATSYHRSVLLRAAWWPPTKAALHALLFLLYVAAAGAYVDTVTLGGLCSSPLAGGPLLSALCRLAGGQAAALVFLFLTALLYLASSIVCIKMWRHEAARRWRLQDAPCPWPVLSQTMCCKQRLPAPCTGNAGELGTGPPRPPPQVPAQGPVPVPCTDSCLPGPGRKYPAIRSAPQREQYKAVFCDQLAEYRELRGRLRAARRALGELDALMSRAPRRAPRWERVSNGEQWEPQPGLSLLEKQERCNYLRKKLLHIKSRIREYDHAAPESSVCF